MLVETLNPAQSVNYSVSLWYLATMIVVVPSRSSRDHDPEIAQQLHAILETTNGVDNHVNIKTYRTELYHIV